MAKKLLRYTPEEKALVIKAVVDLRKGNGSWAEAHKMATEVGYRGGLDSLKQMVAAATKKATKGHRVGNAKKPKGHRNGNSKKAKGGWVGSGRPSAKTMGGSFLGNGRKAFFKALSKLVDAQVQREIKAFKAQFASMLK